MFVSSSDVKQLCEHEGLQTLFEGGHVVMAMDSTIHTRGFAPRPF